MSEFNYTKTALTTKDYYKSINEALKSINGDYHMLHYPFHNDDKDSFRQSQNNLIDYCMGKFSETKDRDLLDIGCGNGVVALHIADNYNVKYVAGVDLNPNNVAIANLLKDKRNKNHVHFSLGDAQNLSQIESNSVDIIINIESAFHYPQKELFLNELYRVLKPGGQFVIADILTTARGHSLLRGWKKKMNFYHWPLSTYQKAFGQSKLQLHSGDDITDKVILGFQNYRNYFKEFNNKGFFQTIRLKLFFLINVKLNVWLLKRRRRYYVFFGGKN